MTDVMEVAELNEPMPEAFNTRDDSPYRCGVCGTALSYGGRGRPPKFCDEHKKTKGNVSGTSTSRGGNLKALENALTELYMNISLGLTMFPATAGDGLVIAEHSRDMARSWVILAETNPRIRKFLTKLTTASGTGAVLMAHIPVAMAIANNHNLVEKVLKRNDD